MSQTIVITSADSIIAPGIFELQVPLAEPLELPGLWSMNLLEVDFTSTSNGEPLYLYTNMVEPTVIGSGQFQILDTVYSSGGSAYQAYRVQNPPSLKQVAFQSVTFMEFTFRNGQGQIPTPVAGAGETVITIQIQQLSTDTFLSV